MLEKIKKLRSGVLTRAEPSYTARIGEMTHAGEKACTGNRLLPKEEEVWAGL
jgi:hypothetical protein